MQRNFILTDLMKTGEHVQIEKFISHHSLPNQTFDMTGEYFTLHGYDLDSYDRKFAIIDRSIIGSYHPSKSLEFKEELNRRKQLLHSQGFNFILATPWESKENIKNMELYPPHTDELIWSADVSWHWFYMFEKHKNNKFNFTHDHNGSYWHKKHNFLYLNKAPREHRLKLYNRLKKDDVLDNSIYTFTMLDNPVRLDKKYELPGIEPEDYPRFGKDQDIYELPYIDTVCSIVSETNDNNNDVFMTEKIWKAIIAQHFFVVHGNYLYLQRLKEMGFKTFGNYFDESYDLERDADKRIDALVSLCKNLKQMCDNGTAVERGNKKWQDLYLQTQGLRKHNYDTFFNEEKLSVQINKTLELFLEFADSR